MMIQADLADGVFAGPWCVAPGMGLELLELETILLGGVDVVWLLWPILLLVWCTTILVHSSSSGLAHLDDIRAIHGISTLQFNTIRIVTPAKQRLHSEFSNFDTW
jgi:hypothetical protein